MIFWIEPGHLADLRSRTRSPWPGKFQTVLGIAAPDQRRYSMSYGCHTVVRS